MSLIEERWVSFQRHYPQVQLHATLNQYEATPGDTIWFSLFFNDADQRPVLGDQWIEVNLWDSSGHAQLRQQVLLRDGKGFNQIALAGSLEPGIYLFTAHSRYMMNFGTESFFKTDIRVVAKQQVVYQSPWLQWGVEGGQLVPGFVNRVAFRMNHSHAEVELANSSGRVVANTRCDSLGYGIIYFKTLVGEQYQMRLAKDTTFTVRLTNSRSAVGLKALDRSGQARQGVCTMNGSVAPFKGKVVATSGSTLIAMRDVSVPPYDSAVIEFPHFENSGRVVSYSLLSDRDTLAAFCDQYVGSANQVQVSVQPGALPIKPRHSIELSVGLQQQGKPKSGVYSLRVVNQSVLTSQLFKPGIFYWDILYRKSPASLSAIMLLDAKPLPWRLIMRPHRVQPHFDYVRVLQKYGVAIDLATGNTLPDYTQFFIFFQQNKLSHRTFTTDGGHIGFAMNGVVGEDELFYLAQLQDREFPHAIVKWQEDTVISLRAPSWKVSTSPSKYGAFSANRKMVEAAFGTQVTPPIEAHLSTEDFESEIATADVTVDIARYIQFSTTEELVKEVVPSLFVRTWRGTKQVRVTLPAPMRPATGSPVFVIDGKATKDADYFLALTPSELKYIKVVYSPKKLMPLGMLGLNGIVLVETRSGTNAPASIDSFSKVTGLTPSLRFANHEHVCTPNVPCFRGTLIWKPLTATQGPNSHSFSFSDDVTLWQAFVEGFTDTGIPFAGAATLSPTPAK